MNLSNPFIVVTFISLLLHAAVLNDAASLPEENMDVPTLIAYNGYQGEAHEVVTKDGYILQIHRVRSSQRKTNDGPAPVFFLQHGLLASSSNWVTNPPKESFAFVLADAGFDVWLGNFRGNKYSQNHKTLDPAGDEFWKFSWDEMAAYDLPAMLGYALNTSRAEELFYAGHSEGTMTAFAQFSSLPDGIAKRVKHFYALAPVAKVANIKGLLAVLGSHTVLLETVLHAVGVKDFMPQTWLLTQFSNIVCGFWISNPLCSNLLFLIAGPNSDQLNTTRLPVYMAHTPAGTSTQNIVHFGQGVLQNTYAKFDYGSERKNAEHYNMKFPPAYSPQKMQVPVTLYYADKDWLADPKDVQYLIDTLTSISQTFELADFNHLDFIWGTRAAAEIYRPIVAHAQSLLKSNT